MKEDIVYFSVNNWHCGIDYPNTPNFIKWLSDDSNQYFANDDWVKENKLCIYAGVIDMSLNYTIAAPKSWVEENCPELLTNDEYEYRINVTRNTGFETNILKGKFSDFLDYPDGDGKVTDHRFEWPYPEYCEENIGVQWYDDEDDNG